MSVELKIKAKHLALEPAIIRKEERKLRERARRKEEHSRQADSLQSHRQHVVSREARATHLARAFIKGIPYEAVEQNKPLLQDGYEKSYMIGRIVAMSMKYHPNRRYDKKAGEWTEEILQWIK